MSLSDMQNTMTETLSGRYVITPLRGLKDKYCRGNDGRVTVMLDNA